MRGLGSPLPFTTPWVRVPAKSAPTPLSLSLISKTCEEVGNTSTIFPTTPSGVITARLRRTWSRSPRLMNSVWDGRSPLSPPLQAWTLRDERCGNSRGPRGAGLRQLDFRAHGSASEVDRVLFLTARFRCDG